MSTMTTDVGVYLGGEIKDLLATCTRCARCVEVCPVVPHGAAFGAEPRQVIGGVLDLLRTGAAPEAASSDWLHGCNGCGDCIPACPEHVNPRRLLMLASMHDAARESRTPQLFRRMARSIKLMIAMQLLPSEYSRLFMPTRPRKAKMVFYTGCNALRTPNLMFNTMAVLDALEVDYEVAGGPSSCCGVIASKWQGELQVGGRVTVHTIKRFEAFEPEKVLNWCPTCDIHMNETMQGFVPREYEFDHVTDYFMTRAERLKELFVQEIPRRVVLHAHHGMPAIGRNVESLLRSIPGLEVVETVLESSYTCGGSGCSKTPSLQAQEHQHLIDRVRFHQADALVTLYHGCHMAFMGLERTEDFEVVNFTELLAQALGQAPHSDRLKELRHLDDWRAIVEASQPLLQKNGLSIDSEWLERHGAEIFSVSEFKGGLDCLATDAPKSTVTPSTHVPHPPTNGGLS